MKAGLREEVRGRLRAMAPEERGRLSMQLCELLCQQRVWREARSVGAYIPFAEEPDIAPAIDAALAEGKTVHLPRYDAVTAVYETCAIASRSELVLGRFGILEPAGHCPTSPLNQLDIILVPGIAFDLTGRRLGRGKGFYDRMLAQVRGHKCGVCFETQVVPAVPEEPHDIRLDSILTPARWHLCPRAV